MKPAAILLLLCFMWTAAVHGMMGFIGLILSPLERHGLAAGFGLGIVFWGILIGLILHMKGN